MKICKKILAMRVIPLSAYYKNQFRCYSQPLVPTADVISTTYHPLLGGIQPVVAKRRNLIAWKTTRDDGIKRLLFKLPQRKPTQTNTGNTTMTKETTENQLKDMSTLDPAKEKLAEVNTGKLPNKVVESIQRSAPEVLAPVVVAQKILGELALLGHTAKKVQASDLTVTFKASNSLGTTYADAIANTGVVLDGLDDLVLKAVIVRAKELEVALAHVGVEVDVQSLLDLPSYTD